MSWTHSVFCRHCGNHRRWAVLDGSWTCTACGTVMHANPTEQR